MITHDITRLIVLLTVREEGVLVVLGALFLYLGKIPSLYKDTHASIHDIFAICGVILNRRTSSTPQSSALQITKIFMIEVVESKRDKFCALQGT